MKKKGADSGRELSTALDIIDMAGRLTPSSVIVAGGDRVEDMMLVESARDHGFVDRIMLVGRKPRILKKVRRLGLDIPEGDIIHAEGPEETAARTVEAALDQDIDILLKGGVSTSVLSRSMMRLANRPTAGLVSMLDAATLAGGRLLFLSDPAVTTICNFGRLSGIIRNAVDVARTVAGIARPRVAVLSAYEGVIPSLPSTRIARELAGLDWPDAWVCGPLSFDLATDPRALEVKGRPDLPNADRVAGRADILIGPNIETGNVLYKCISAQARFGQASLANIAVGFDVAYGIISRADSVETRLASIALCGVYAQRIRVRRRVRSAPAGGASTARTVMLVHPGREAVRACVFREDRLVREVVEAWDPASGWARDRLGEEVESVVRRLAAAIRRGGAGPVNIIGCVGGVVDPGAVSPGRDAVAIALKKEKGFARDAMLEELNLSVAGWAGLVPLGVPLAGGLAVALSAPAALLDPVPAGPEISKSSRNEEETARAVGDWLAPAVLRRAEADFGLPKNALRVLLCLPSPRPVVALLKEGVVRKCRTAPPDISPASRDGEGDWDSARRWIFDTLKEELREAENCLHAVIPVGEGPGFSEFVKPLKAEFGVLAPILSFDGKPETVRAAGRLLRLLDEGFAEEGKWPGEESMRNEKVE